eukprot:GCRY01002101.1.p1 GENE.GCRY01002101.1~~GCRY01002101.1.p1  ORF type:complete len:379 (+),score=75.38 GCRY01002101.1:165-1301(+)
MEEKLFEACEKGELEAVKLAIKEGADIWAVNDEGKNALIIATCKEHLPIIQHLLECGSPWNTLDHSGASAGDYALQLGHTKIYEELVNAGVRTELTIRMLEEQNKYSMGEDGMEEAVAPVETEESKIDGAEAEAETVSDMRSASSIGSQKFWHGKKVPNLDYLSQKLTYSEGRLVDEQGNGVMMGWEDPLMKRHAEIICSQKDSNGQAGRVLNVGFGLGIIDTYIQEHKPVCHTIIEAHPDVYQHMLNEGWDKKPGVEIVFGRWQDVIHSLGPFDGVFFDTYGEFYEDMIDFHEVLPTIMKVGGIYSYFNGLAATNQFFHDVSNKVAEMDLKELNFSVSFETIPMQVQANDKATWDGIRQKYWCLDFYKLPTCVFKGF